MRLLRTGAQILAVRGGQVALTAAAGLLIARTLGPREQGFYSLTLAGALLAAAALNGGVGLAAVPALRSGEASARRLLRAQLWWIAAVGGALALTALAAAGPAREAAARWLGWDAAAAAAAAVIVLGALAGDVFFYDLLALGRLVAGPLLNLARAGVLLAGAGALALGGGLGLTSALAAYAAAQAAGAAGLLGLLLRTARGGAGEPAASTGPVPPPAGGPRPPSPQPAPRALLRRLLACGWVGQFSAVAAMLHQRLDLALVTVWHGAAAAGVYSIALLLGELLWNLPAALSPVLVYTSAAPDGGPRRDRLAARAVRAGLLATLAAAVPLAALAGWLIPALFGPAYAGAAAPLRTRLPGVVAYAVGGVLAGDFIGRGRAAWNTQASVLTAAVNAAAGLWLIPRHGLAGAGWASTLAYLAGATWMLLRFRGATRLSLREILWPARTDRHTDI